MTGGPNKGFLTGGQNKGFLAGGQNKGVWPAVNVRGAGRGGRTDDEDQTIILIITFLWSKKNLPIILTNKQPWDSTHDEEQGGDGPALPLLLRLLPASLSNGILNRARHRGHGVVRGHNRSSQTGPSAQFNVLPGQNMIWAVITKYAADRRRRSDDYQLSSVRLSSDYHLTNSSDQFM